MLKALVYMSKRHDLTRDEFIDYYETKHIHLVRRLLPTISGYRRNYLDFSQRNQAHGEAQPETHPGHDVVTEIWFETEEDWQTFLATIGDPVIAAEIAADELNFMNRDLHRFFSVDEFVSTDR